MKNYKIIFKIIIFLLLAKSIAFSQVQVILKQPPLNQLHVEDLWKITIINQTKTAYSIYIIGVATEFQQGEVIRATSGVFSLPVGVKVVSSGEVGNVDIHYKNSEIKNLIKSTGSVPSGSYTICIDVYNSMDNSIIGSMCINQEVNNLSKPILLSPLNASVESEEFPVFNWFPPSPIRAGQNVTYTLSIVEMLPRQTSLDAMLSNPAWYDETRINTTITQYSPASRRFENRKKYAWKVKAYINGLYVNESEVQEFTFIDMNISEKSDFNVKTKKNEDKKIKHNMNYDFDNHSFNEIDTGSLLKGLMHKYNSGLLAYNRETSVDEKVEDKLIFHELKFSKINTNNFIFGGSIRIIGQNANRKGTGMDIPSNFATGEFNPVFTIYKIPFSINALLTSERNTSKQNINNIGLNFDLNTFITQVKKIAEEKILNPSINSEYDELVEKVKNPNLNEDEIKKLKERIGKIEEMRKDFEEANNSSNPQTVISKVSKYVNLPAYSKLLSSIKNIGVGTNYPSYTDYTLNGVPLTGGNLEINPGLIYFAATGIRNQKPIQLSDNGQPTYGRKIFSTRAGVGNYDASHIYLTYLYGWDDPSSVTRDSTVYVTPMKNHLFGMQGKLSLFKNIFNLEAEANASLLTRDATSPQIQNSPIPSFLTKLFGVNMSSSVDYLYAFKSSLDFEQTKTKVNAGFKYIGPGYNSLGAPNVRNDNLSYDIKIDQQLIKNQVTISAFVRRERDNLIQWKTSTTSNTFFGFTAGIHFNNYPYLQVNYSPFRQSNSQNVDSLKMDNNTSILNVSTGYGYKINDIYNFTNITFSYQDSKTSMTINNYSTNTLFINHTVTFLIPLSLTGAFSVTENRMFGLYTKIVSYDLSGAYTFFKRLQNSAGIDISKEHNNNIKYGIYVSSNITIPVIGNLDLRAEKNVYKDRAIGIDNYNEFIFRATLTSNW